MTRGAHATQFDELPPLECRPGGESFQILAFERSTPDAAGFAETALAMILGDVTHGAPSAAHPFAVLHRRGVRVAPLRLQRTVGDCHASDRRGRTRPRDL